jgi:uncharacterized protein
VVSGEYEERVVAFECEGERLLGVVTAPAAPAALGVLVVVGGPQYRIGSHRQYVLLARRLARGGVAAMRFDYRGMGDSTGASIGFEDAVPDIGAAMDGFVQAQPSVTRIVLWGLCDAASVALMYWERTRDPRVAGLVLADPWISSEEAFAESQARHYLRRPFQREFWMKLARGGVALRRALHDVAAVAATVLRAKSGEPAFAEAPYQERMTRGIDEFPGPVLLLLSGDLGARDFMQYCEVHPRWMALLDKASVTRGEVPGSNHTFASARWRSEVERLTIEWLASQLPPRDTA